MQKESFSDLFKINVFLIISYVSVWAQPAPHEFRPNHRKPHIECHTSRHEEAPKVIAHVQVAPDDTCRNTTQKPVIVQIVSAFSIHIGNMG